MSLIQGYLVVPPGDSLYTKIPILFAERCSTSLLNFGISRYSCAFRYPQSQPSAGHVRYSCAFHYPQSQPSVGHVEVKYILAQACSIPLHFYIKLSVNAPGYNAEKERQFLLFRELFGTRAKQTSAYLKIDKRDLQGTAYSGNNTVQSLFVALIIKAISSEFNTLANNLHIRYWRTLLSENNGFSLEQIIFLIQVYVEMQFSDNRDYRRILNYDVPLNANDLDN